MTTRAIIIGAGRGERLMPTTADAPKCFAEVGGRRILDWTVEALASAGVEQIAFIGEPEVDTSSKGCGAQASQSAAEPRTLLPLLAFALALRRRRKGPE